MQPKLTIQERLKDLRVERGLTLEQLSAETGISKSALGKYEADDFKDISPFSMVELAKFYGVSTDYLLGRFYRLMAVRCTGRGNCELSL